MMRFSVNLIPALAVTCACMMFSSCSKKDDGPSETRRNLVGNWKITGAGGDMNGNKLIEPDEITPVPESAAFLSTYAADGTGSGIINTGVFPINTTTTWELGNEDKTLKVVYTSSSISFTRYYQIVNISTSRLTLADTSGTPWTFTVSARQ